MQMCSANMFICIPCFVGNFLCIFYLHYYFRATLSNMEDYLLTSCQFTKPHDSLFEMPDTPQKTEEILEKYYFPMFPVFSKKLVRVLTMPRLFWPKRPRAVHLETAHSIDDIENISINVNLLPTDDGFKLGTKLGYLLDNKIGGARDLIYDKVFEGLAKHLNVGHPSEAIWLLSQFSYGNDFFFDEIKTARPPQVKINGDLEKKVVELFEMAFESAIEPNYSSSRSILPLCSWRELGECWTKIVSEQGICYTNYKEGGQHIFA